MAGATCDVEFLVEGVAPVCLAPGVHVDRMRGPQYGSHVVPKPSATLEARRPDARLDFWHQQGRDEVDLVVEDGRRTVVIEIKAATSG